MSIDIFAFENDILAKAKTYKIPGMDWEDVAQELRLAVWRARDKFNPKLAGARTFVVKVIINRLRDLARTAGRKKRYLDNNTSSLEEIREKLNLGEFDAIDTRWWITYIRNFENIAKMAELV